MHLIRESGQIRALRTLKRQAIVDILDATGPSSAAEIAALMGCAPDRLYYHLQRLTTVGLLKGRLAPHGEGRQSTVYALQKRQPRLLYVPGDRTNVTAVNAVVASMLREAARSFRSALRPGIDTSSKRREIWAGRRVGWLTAVEREMLNRLLHRVIALFRTKRHPTDTARMYSLTFSLSPFRTARVAGHPRRRRRQG